MTFDASKLGSTSGSLAGRTTLTLNAQWLNQNATPTLANMSNTAMLKNSNAGYFYRDYWYPWYEPTQHHYHTTTTVTARPIKLTMSEVERLRVAAKKDKDLRATLAKFTDHIEVVVDFE